MLQQTEGGVHSVQPVNSCLLTITGETAPIHGKAKIDVAISSEMWIDDITDECILGLDF